MLILLWLRQRGFVFWFSVALVIVTIGTLIGMLAAIGSSQGNISFRFLKAKPDLSRLHVGITPNGGHETAP